MGKAVKKAVAKVTARPSLRALRDGSHSIGGTVYTYAKGDIVKLSKAEHLKSMKFLTCLEEL